MEDELRTLMQEWASAHSAQGLYSFIDDGAVCVPMYKTMTPKICFFLKEAYSAHNEERWSLCEWLSRGGMTRMWSAVSMWSYGIFHTTKDRIPCKPELTREQKTALLQSIAVVNVKKSNGQSASHYEELWNFAMEDQDYLRRELSILCPDVIVCGNNSSLLKILYEEDADADSGQYSLQNMHKNGFAIVHEQIILDYYHPANLYPTMLNYYTVCALYQQALLVRDEKT